MEGTRVHNDGAPAWSTKLWLGGDLFALWGLLLRGRFAVHWSCLFAATFDVAFSFFHTLLGNVENVIYGRRVRRTAIEHAPLFIIGHWRTGTTLLHELLALDERHTYPTSYDCFSPCHFLLTGNYLPRWVRFIMPTRRPMDNMAMGWNKPQEEEFALALLGIPSPYNSIAFPNLPPVDQDYLDLQELAPDRQRRWQTQYLRFLQRLTFRDPRRLVLKSPAHTARLRTLKKMFPESKFIHIVRDPYRVFPSTVHLWKVLYRKHGFQIPNYRGLEEQVFQTFLKLHQRLEEDRDLIGPGHFHELRYEDLIRNPIEELRKLYQDLDLGDFERSRPRWEAYLSTLSDYETNRYQLTPEQEAEITLRWGEIIRRQGYERSPA